MKQRSNRGRSFVKNGLIHGLCATLAAASLPACGGGGLGGAPPKLSKLSDARADLQSCDVVTDPLNPLIVEWPATQSTTLHATSQRGLVIVSYSGCNTLKILEDCSATGNYDFIETPQETETLLLKRESDLTAKVPLVKASLRGHLSQGNQLMLRYTTTGQRQALAPPAQLVGQCEGATHYIRRLTMGAYSLGKSSAHDLSGEIGVGSLGASGSSTAALSNLSTKPRNLESCLGDGLSSTQRSERCAILQLGLSPLSIDGANTILSGGFGRGLDAKIPMPEIGPLKASDVFSADELNSREPWVSSVERAIQLESQANTPAANRADAWVQASQLITQPELKGFAESRSKLWLELARTGARAAEQQRAVCSQHQKDLAQYKQLTRSPSISIEQKNAYRTEFREIYAPWSNELKQCSALDNQAANVENANNSAIPVAVDPAAASKPLAPEASLESTQSLTSAENKPEPPSSIAPKEAGAQPQKPERTPKSGALEPQPVDGTNEGQSTAAAAPSGSQAREGKQPPSIKDDASFDGFTEPSISEPESNNFSTTMKVLGWIGSAAGLTAAGISYFYFRSEAFSPGRCNETTKACSVEGRKMLDASNTWMTIAAASLGVGVTGLSIGYLFTGGEESSAPSASTSRAPSGFWLNISGQF